MDLPGSHHLPNSHWQEHREEQGSLMRTRRSPLVLPRCSQTPTFACTSPSTLGQITSVVLLGLWQREHSLPEVRTVCSGDSESPQPHIPVVLSHWPRKPCLLSLAGVPLYPASAGLQSTYAKCVLRPLQSRDTFIFF